MTETQRLMRAARELQRQAAEQARSDYPVGRKVRWKHGQQVRSAFVVGYGAGLRIRVRSERVLACDDREYWVSLERIE